MSKEFLALTKDEQERLAVEKANEYFKKAEYWKKIAIKARLNKIEKDKD